MGKGDSRRPAAVDEKTFEENWRRTFGCKHERQVTPEGQYTKFKCLDCGAVGDVPRGKDSDETVLL